MNHQPAPLQFGLAFAFLIFFITIVQIGILRIAFDKLGLTQQGAYLLLFASLFGSLINLPLFSIRSDAKQAAPVPDIYRQLLHKAMPEFKGRTLIAVNVGGAIVPSLFSVYLVLTRGVDFFTIVIATLIITLICRFISRPLPGIGIGMPIFIAPISAALVALLLAPEHSPVLAYVSGTLGVLLGADLLRFKDIRTLGTPIASIGGAGTFDGIFITGIVAVLLA
ncbi:DUF1614 domain-containing protein [Sulfuriflexus mobilis]|uniref:DUF1614 domain-containing protein n=1 Tax=Sulfuriflexus mobilis TaxID=1811807 RepID=UPI00155986A4|nr:DUF1614 domain-containing protein [Sulfuriflexus mobilis]